MAESKSILSPIPGVFYRRPAPDQDVYVKEGDTVKVGDTIGLIEVMKNFYEIKAESDGVLERFCVENEEIVDAGQEIAVIKR
ncbi:MULTISPECIES: acetyl-CoA carboxylase [Aneurinibacillus]|uniref:Biotin carboxyl carrier protein of acetyl-CoA carboxylase n=1 Tax=Aneurinibacillus thermoaerophilus TaxID=143495 RepID=A0A1G7Y300_ANETH|nr:MULTISPECIES: acetyl-CoA carboxylase [Aneurinibacillus]AMA72948.1 acetyl-CoA carboxylase biotin carboxyl carrier protein subunit [Aneurinibacillus sp. XH2]MED0675888.1 acetyl-CoA carboxylase [Aneurinibacillus thermoaerophilus]MED0677837.1 acetyl-CoA carboxylase [Aneurinibacillus thermoaerophilus]MED0737586.1 acetyl-CoA carboxylase [Aneurinibacillus thermoaerophilus]MED0758157.1 acetyl-CoA carboxylase [Aneurinibacillus thermoaerophilus]